MKASELRIGNYILMDFFSANPDEPHRVIAKDIANIVRYKNKIEGVPLTEDWLVKFGFKKLKNSGYHDSELIYWSLNDFSLYVGYNGSINLGYEGGEYHECEPVNDYEIKYVHQLQNLYFALTGEELEVRNEK